MIALFLILAAIVGTAAVRAGLDNSHPSRWRSCAFFALLAALLGCAQWLEPTWVGALVVVLMLLGSSGLKRALPAVVPEQVDASMASAGRLFLPIALLAVLSVLGAFAFKAWPMPGFGERQAVAALLIAATLSLLLALRITHARPRSVIPATAGLLDAMGWAFVLPLLLAVLGGLLAQAGVGTALSQLAAQWLWVDSRLVCVLAYGLGMAGLTMLTGNAFAAFPVILGAIGVPFLILEHGANPAPLAAIGMLCGYCGTLMTPMAANFNLVPAALLDLPDRNAVIRAQFATALPLLGCNLALLYWLV